MINTIESFYEKADQTAELQEQMANIDQSSPEAASKALASLARDHGYDLAPEAFLFSSKELKDAELEEVAGGFQVCWNTFKTLEDGTKVAVKVCHNK
jgi:hypothetical protein